MLAGGSGSRFWPASRRGRPKPFIPLLGDETLFDQTLVRLRQVTPPERTWVVAPRSLERLTRAALRPHPGVRALFEPVARNTAPAVAWAAAVLASQAEPGLMAMFPADHRIPSAGAFARTVRTAARAAADGDHIVLIGIEPSRPDTAYGYLRLADGASRGAVRVRQFVEKPSPSRARRFVRSGRYLWNAGMLVARPERILEETRRQAPGVWRGIRPIARALEAGSHLGRAALERAYRRAAPISFDYAVLERSRRVLAVRGRFGWSDLGSWDALGEHLARRGGNRVGGAPPAASVDARGNVLWNGTDKAVTLLGVTGLVVVESEDALLVCSQDRAQDVRRIVEALERGGRSDLV